MKVLLPSLAGNTQALARLQREADMMSALRHPHIVQILDFNVTEQGVPFLVMELLSGWPLTGGSMAGPPFGPRAAVRIVDQIADALAAAHALGIVHLDLKPDNVILVPTDGRGDFVKVIDFGISQAIGQDRLASDPLIAGTPEYMAPEQVGGSSKEIDHRADQFSLAALAYRPLTGHQPFDGGDPLTLLHQVVNETPVPLSRRVPALGRAVDAVIARAMSKRASDRFPHVRAFADALRAAVEVVESNETVRAASEPDTANQDPWGARSDAASRARDEFVGIVDHELRSILTSVLGDAGLIVDAELGAEEHREQVLAHARRLQRSGARMNRVIGDLVDLASIEAGVLAVNRQLGDPSQIVTETVDRFQNQAASSGLSLAADVDVASTLAEFDSARILQVLANLVESAIESTPRGGQVVVHLERAGDELRFAVRDTGSGIRREHLDSVFEGFRGFDGDERGGARLGLYISKCIVQGHGGRIWAESGARRGSTFWFTLAVAGAG